MKRVQSCDMQQSFPLYYYIRLFNKGRSVYVIFEVNIHKKKGFICQECRSELVGAVDAEFKLNSLWPNALPDCLQLIDTEEFLIWQKYCRDTVHHKLRDSIPESYEQLPVVHLSADVLNRIAAVNMEIDRLIRKEHGERIKFGLAHKKRLKGKLE